MFALLEIVRICKALKRFEVKTLKFRVIRSRLYVHINETTALELLAKWPKQKIQCTVLIWVEGLFQCHIAAEHIKVAFTLRLSSQF